MNNILKFNQFFCFSEKENKYFYRTFGNKINLIYGKNTSGKSTVFQAILYTFGINDVKRQLSEVLKENIIFRLDCSLNNQNITFIRNNESLYIKVENEPIISFHGINGNNANERTKLKEYIAKLFTFNLKLESKDEYKLGSIESLFLPYYISQSVGWVYIRKSFSQLDFFKNFKYDYLDYYLGIENSFDRIKKQNLEKKRELLLNEIEFYKNFEIKNDKFKLTILQDEDFKNRANLYLENYKMNQDKLVDIERIYVSKCNELSFLKSRKNVLRRVNTSHKKQNRLSGHCPSCTRPLKFTIEEQYEYLQEKNDTEKQLNIIEDKLKSVQSEINSFNKTIQELNKTIEEQYELVKKYQNSNISFKNWIDNKTRINIIENIEKKLTLLNTKLNKVNDDLNEFKSEKDISNSRYEKENEFQKIFVKYLEELNVTSKLMEEDKFIKLYQISSFPFQGVELHKTVMAYNFAFNKIISKTNNIHRLPFMLDAIFKEDIESSNKDIILKFINKYKPIDTQIFISIADVHNENLISQYNKEYFNNELTLVNIGNSEKERAFLEEYNNEHEDYLEETFEIIDSI